jgi:predicted double-glycine peptidase
MKIKILLLQLLLIMSACDDSGTSEAAVNQLENEMGLPAESEMELHGLSGERLRTIMQDISLTIHDSTNVDTQTDKLKQQSMDDMIEAVEELLFHAEMMSTDLPVSNLTESDVIVFRALAGQLYTEALNIQQTSRNYDFDTYDYELLDVNYHRLNQACIACHQMFRDK